MSFFNIYAVQSRKMAAASLMGVGQMAILHTDPLAGGILHFCTKFKPNPSILDKRQQITEIEDGVIL